MTTPTVTPAATREQASCGASKAKTNNDSFASSASQQLARDLEGIKGKLESIADAERSEPYKPLVKQIPIADGFLMLEVKIPPKQDVLHKAGEWLGLSRPEPISYCIKDRSGSQLLELHLDLSSHGESLVKVRKFDGYSGVRYDEAIQNFVGATKDTEAWLAKIIKDNHLSYKHEILRAEQELPPSDQKKLLSLISLANQALSQEPGQSIKLNLLEISGRSKGLSQLDPNPGKLEIAALTEEITDLMKKPGGFGELAQRYPRATIDTARNKITIQNDDLSIEVTGTRRQTWLTLIKSFLLATSEPPRSCLVTKHGERVLNLTLNEDSEPTLIKCGNFHHLEIKDGVLHASDRALMHAHTDYQRALIENANPANPFSTMKVSQELATSKPPTRPLESDEGEQVLALMQNVLRALEK